MKKRLKYFSFLVLALFAFAACGNTGSADQKIIVGASPGASEQVLEFAKPLLKEKGYDLEIVMFNDYILPNKALDAGEIDANLFQHIPFYNLQVEENNFDFAIASEVYIAPIGLYSQRYKTVDEIPEGAEIYFSNSVADHGRILSLLERQKLITLDAKVTDKTKATLDDIVENPKKLIFTTDFAPELLPQMYKQDEADIVIINTGYAVNAGLHPQKDAFVVEDNSSVYVNIVAVQKGDENSPKIKALDEVLTSQAVKDFIVETFEGDFVPV